MGTPELALESLSRIHNSSHEIIAVYTNPPKPKNRGMKLEKTPVHILAEQMGLKVYTPASLKSENLEEFMKLKADIGVLVAYGKIIPQAILDHFPNGVVNLHPSLLPRWRGAAPLQRPILAGDSETGICIMKMTAELDAGDIYMQERIQLNSKSTSGWLHDLVAKRGAEMLVQTLDDIEQGRAKLAPQPEGEVVYASKITKKECEIDWSKPAVHIDRMVRAFNPWPSAYFSHKGNIIKVHKGEIIETNHFAEPGSIIDNEFTIACGKEAYRPLILQKAGKRKMSLQEFLNGFKLPDNRRL